MTTVRLTDAQITTCEIIDCGEHASAMTHGVRVCERCRQKFASVGFGAVYFAGRWHGVIGATYTAEQAAAYPGLMERRNG